MSKEPSEKPGSFDKEARQAARKAAWEKFTRSLKKASEVEDRSRSPVEIPWATLARLRPWR